MHAILWIGLVVGAVILFLALRKRTPLTQEQIAARAKACELERAEFQKEAADYRRREMAEAFHQNPFFFKDDTGAIHPMLLVEGWKLADGVLVVNVHGGEVSISGELVLEFQRRLDCIPRNFPITVYGGD